MQHRVLKNNLSTLKDTRNRRRLLKTESRIDSILGKELSRTIATVINQMQKFRRKQSISLGLWLRMAVAIESDGNSPTSGPFVSLDQRDGTELTPEEIKRTGEIQLLENSKLSN